MGFILVPRGLDIGPASQGTSLPFAEANSEYPKASLLCRATWLHRRKMVLSKLFTFSFIAFTLLSEKSRTFCIGIERVK